MNRITGSALLLAALFSTGIQADDGMSLQQQRDKIGDEMVRERTGTPPADINGAGQSTTDQQQQQQQGPRSTLNSPARQNGTGTGTEPGTDNRRQPSDSAPANGSQTAPSTQGGSTAPATPGTGGGSQGVGGAITQ